MRRAHKQIPPIFIGLRRPGALLKNRPWTPQNFCLWETMPQKPQYTQALQIGSPRRGAGPSAKRFVYTLIPLCGKQ